MYHFDVKGSLDSMVILVDTREQDTPSLRRRLELMKCPWERQKLDFGDYSAKCRLPDGEWLDLSPKVAVERKMSFDELCACFCRGRQRFTREFERAREAGAAVYLLIENASWENALAGKYRSKMNPKSFIASMTAWLARYRCQLIFCKSETTGVLIHEILYRELKEVLESKGGIQADEVC